MPVYSIQTPDGRTVDIEADDQATAMRGAQQFYASSAGRGGDLSKVTREQPQPGDVQIGKHDWVRPATPTVEGVTVTASPRIAQTQVSAAPQPALTGGGDKVAPGGLAGLISGQPKPDNVLFTEGQDYGHGFASLPTRIENASPGLLKALADAHARETQGPGAPLPQERSFVEGATLNGASGLDANMAGATTAVHNWWDRMTGGPGSGYNAADAYRAVSATDRGLEQKFSQDHPYQDTGFRLAGGLATPGLGAAGEFVAAPTMASTAIKGSGLLTSAARVTGGALERGVRSGGVGGVAGAIAGYNAAPDGARLQGAADGAGVGAGLGLALPVALGAAGAVASKTIAPVARTLVRTANKAVASASGTAGFLDPTLTAQSRLAEALKADGVDQNTVKRAVADWMATGAPPPYIQNIAGNNTQRLLRAAAAKAGPAGEAAQSFADQIGGDLQPAAMRRTQALVDDPRSAPQLESEITLKRQNDANRMYQVPYVQRVDPGPVMEPIGGDAGRRAITAAHRESDAMLLPDQTLELKALKGAAGEDGISTPQPGDSEALAWARRLWSGQAGPDDNVSLGSLDRIKVALNRMGDKLLEQEPSARGEASGYFDRAKMIDDYLGQQSGAYQDARDTYAQHSNLLDALKAGDINVITHDPAKLRLALQDLQSDPAQMRAAQIAVRQKLAEAIGAQKAGAVGQLNSIGTASNVADNLSQLFSPGEAQLYQGAIRNMVKQVGDARFVAPNTGAKTSNVLLDQETLPKIPTSKHGLIAMAVDKLMSGVTMTDAERQALVELGQQPAAQLTAIDGGVAPRGLPSPAAAGPAAAPAAPPTRRYVPYLAGVAGAQAGRSASPPPY